MNSKKKVLIITYYWPPAGGSGVQRWVKMAKYLEEFNISPIILTVQEAYAAYPVVDQSFNIDISNSIEVIKTKSRNYYSFFKIFNKQYKVPQGGVGNKSKSSIFQYISLFIRNHIFVPDPRIGWNKYALKEAKKIITEKNIDIFITTSPPHSTQLIGLELKKWRSDLQWLADFRDPWTDIFYYKDLKHTFISDYLNKKKEIDVLSKSNLISVVSPNMKNIFESKGIDESKIKVIPNGFDESDFKDKNLLKNSKFTISYIGIANAHYDISSFIKALEKFGETHDYQLNIIGEFTDELLSKINNTKVIKNINFLGYLPHKEAVKYTNSSDLLLLVIPNVPNNKLIYTGKLFEYIASDNPILCIGPKNGDAEIVIEKNKFGKSFEYTEVSKIYDFICSVSNGDFRRNTNINDVNKYSRKNLAYEFSKLIK
jgi:glycosyltransferase involved in cell wall biosynthesis